MTQLADIAVLLPNQPLANLPTASTLSDIASLTDAQFAVPSSNLAQFESQRLEKLESYEIMHTGKEAEFERITTLIKAYYDVPVVGISFIDKHHQFIKSSVGIDMPLMPRQMSICNYTIQGSAPFIVYDTHQNELLKDHALVVGEPFVRFYAGFPILVNNEQGKPLAMGALCLVDNQVRHALTVEQIQALQNFAQIISDTLQLRLDKIRATRASSNKTAFLTNMSHEIRTPMAGIVGLLESLSQTSLDEQQTEYVSHIQQANEHLLMIVDDMLELSQVESGSLAFDHTAVDLSQLCHQLIASHQQSARDKNIVVGLEYPDTLPTVMQLDAKRIYKVLNKLVSNGIQFTRPGGQVTLKVQGTCLSSHIHIDVVDTGIGITPQTQAVIFEAYEQADKFTHRMYGGVGLGLSLCRALAKAMGGNLTVSSQTGQGTTFSLVLPLVLDETTKNACEVCHTFHTDDSKKVPTESTSVSQVNHTMTTNETAELPRLSAHILLVEDNELNAMVALKTLKKYGYTADRAKDGQEAVNLFTEAPSKYQMILMDHQMPIMDGVQATKILKERFDTTLPPVIAVTAHATHGDQSIYFDVGMQDCIAKPYKPEMLDKVIQKWLHIRPTMKDIFA